MYLGRPIFAGTSCFNQLEKIIEVTGKPSHDISDIIASETSQAVLKSFESSKARALSEIYPTLDPLVCDLLTKMLQFDPRRRPRLEAIISHPYLQRYRQKVHFGLLTKPIVV